MPRTRQQIPTYLNRRGRGAVVVYRGGVRTEITLPGKYLWRILQECRRRPLYLVMDRVGWSGPAPKSEDGPATAPASNQEVAHGSGPAA